MAAQLSACAYVATAGHSPGELNQHQNTIVVSLVKNTMNSGRGAETTVRGAELGRPGGPSCRKYAAMSTAEAVASAHVLYAFSNSRVKRIVGDKCSCASKSGVLIFQQSNQQLLT
jgi:hypothetical protein